MKRSELIKRLNECAPLEQDPDTDIDFVRVNNGKIVFTEKKELTPIEHDRLLNGTFINYGHLGVFYPLIHQQTDALFLVSYLPELFGSEDARELFTFNKSLGDIYICRFKKLHLLSLDDPNRYNSMDMDQRLKALNEWTSIVYEEIRGNVRHNILNKPFDFRLIVELNEIINLELRRETNNRFSSISIYRIARHIFGIEQLATRH